MFKNEFQTKEVPSKSRIYNWAKNYDKYSTVSRLNSKSQDREKHSGRPMAARGKLDFALYEKAEFGPFL